MSTPMNIGMIGEARRREETAKKRREKYTVDPDVRAARAEILQRRETLMAGQQAAAKAAKDAAPDALRVVLSRGTVDELAEISRMISRLDGRRLQALVDGVFCEKSRMGYVRAPESAVQTRSGRKATQAA